MRALLLRAAEADRYFQVIYVVPSSDNDTHEGSTTINILRSLSVPVATIPDSAVAYSLATRADLVIVGAEGVVENGGIISRLGTYQIGLLAKAMGKPFYVASESYKFVRMYPLGQDDLPIEQNIVQFEASLGEKTRVKKGDVGKGEPLYGGSETYRQDYFGAPDVVAAQVDSVDYTPPGLISALITENGVLTPSAVSEELIKLWF